MITIIKADAIAFATAAAIPLAVLLGPSPALRAAGSIEVCIYAAPDVPTHETFSSQTFLPNEVFRYEGNPPSYLKVLTLPTDVRVSGLFRLDTAGGWLFSVETPTSAGGALSVPAEARDVVKRVSGGGLTKFFCGDTVIPPVPATSRIDALYLDGGDAGDLVVSFDVPTRLNSIEFEPSDLVRYQRTGGGTCASWQIAAANPVFDGSSAGTGVPLQSNAVGASNYAGRITFSPDVPTLLSPPGITVVPGQLVYWDGSQYSIFASLQGWPISSNLHGTSHPGNPGTIGDGFRVDKSTATSGNVVLTWTSSCSVNGPRSAIYEGTIGSWNSHTQITCTDTGNDKREDITPGAGSSYYLVVPWNPQGEGSYGARPGPVERPRGVDTCSPVQVLAACPA